jgi:hypothetical protein
MGMEIPIFEIPTGDGDGTRLAFSADGKWLATSTASQGVLVWEMASGQPIRRFSTEGHRLQADPVFSPDGGRLATGFGDSSALIWDLAPTRRPTRTTANDFDAAWRLLADNDPALAFEAGFTFDSAAAEAVAFFRARVAPVPRLADRVRALIRELDAEEFDTRERATAELIRLHKRAEKAVRQAATTSTSSEVRRRAERILGHVAVPPPGPDTIRTLRAVQILQRLNTPKARTLLERLASGEPTDRLTEEARASLDFIARRAGTHPGE